MRAGDVAHHLRVGHAAGGAHARADVVGAARALRGNRGAGQMVAKP